MKPRDIDPQRTEPEGSHGTEKFIDVEIKNGLLKIALQKSRKSQTSHLFTT